MEIMSALALLAPRHSKASAATVLIYSTCEGLLGHRFGFPFQKKGTARVKFGHRSGIDRRLFMRDRRERAVAKGILR